MGRDRKVQLGVRVSAEARERALQQAQSRGVSLNVLVEQLIWRIQDLPAAAPEVPELVSDDAVGLDPLPVDVPVFKRFERNCKNGTYHFRHGPGDPCRYCLGEVD